MKTRTGAARLPIRAAAVLLSVVLGVLGCSGSTRYVLILDGLSFVPEADRAAEVAVPTVPLLRLDLYFLPGIQVDASGAGPNPEQSCGVAVEVPLPQPPPPEVRLKLEVRGRVVVANLGTLPADPALLGVTIELYVDEPESADIYGGGSVLALASHPALDPGETADLSFDAAMEEGDPLYADIAGGSFRLGLKVSLTGNTLGLVQARYAVEELVVELSAYPFGVIP